MGPAGAPPGAWGRRDDEGFGTTGTPRRWHVQGGFRIPALPLPSSPPRMPYTLLMLWRDRRRFLPALLAIGLSAVRIGVQRGLVLGLVLAERSRVTSPRS